VYRREDSNAIDPWYSATIKRNVLGYDLWRS
jgi:hypothetical protein